MYRRLQKDNAYLINQQLLLKARLLDMLVADWDRHSNNWRWGKKDSGGLTFYYAIPRDRDWAFYQGGGILPKIARLVRMPYLINFGDELQQVKSLSRKAHGFDAFFLNSLAAEDWLAVIRQMQQSLSDSAIQAAVRKLPRSVFDSLGGEFVRRLKNRRDGLEGAVMPYYRFLATGVQVNGTAESELFSVLPAAEGLRLQVYQLGKDGSKGRKLYERVFHNGETRRVLLFGLAGDDRFEVSKDVGSSIMLSIDGGSGQNSYTLGGNLRIQVKEATKEDQIIVNNPLAKIRFR
jgi:hypothetical protein